MAAPKTIVPSGYQVDLDRDPPRSAAGCSGSIVFVLSSIAVLLAGGYMVLNSGFLGSPQSTPTTAPTETATQTPDATPTAIVDDWSATGTALYLAGITPTTDYCWWLTPTPPATPTLEFTPDAWSATGTALYEATYPPVAHTATPDVPRVWCNHIPTYTATITPLSLNGLSIAITQEAAPPTYTATITPLSLNMVSTAPPAPVQPVQPPPVTQEWTIILPTVGAPFVPSNTPTPIGGTATKAATQTPIIIIVTATASNTLTETPTATATASATASPTATYNPEITADVFPTATATATAY